MFRHSIFLIMIFVFLVTCKKKSRDEGIFSEYQLVYNSTENKTYAWAFFTSSNFRMELDDNSSVRFNGQTLSFVSVYNYYELVMEGQVDSGQFEWTSPANRIYRNSISFKPVYYQDSIDTIDVTTDFSFLWSGDSLGSYEYLSLFIDSKDEKDIEAYEYFTNDFTFIVNQTKMNYVSNGPAELIMERRNWPPMLESGESGGKIIGIYQCPVKKVFMR